MMTFSSNELIWWTFLSEENKNIVMNFIFFPGKNNNDETFHQEEALQPEPVG